MRGKANNLKWLLCVLFLMGPVHSTAAGRIIYVDADAVGANDGSSWADAFNYLQDALADAETDEKPIEIRIAEGVYKPDQGAGITPGDHEATFRLINGVTLAGGYAGFGGTDSNARNVELYKTILSGDLSGNNIEVNHPNDFSDEQTYNDNSHNIVTSSKNGPEAIIDGFIISYGNGRGSGITITSGGPTILNCTFKYNDGIAIWIGDGQLLLENCNFIDNSDSAIYSRQSSLKLIECSFIGNQADSGGGVWSWGDAVLTNCVFRDNSASDKGGALAHNGGVLELIDCEFANNSVSWTLSSEDDSEGGALWAGTSEKVAIKNCIFNNNSASFGGAIRGYGNHQIDNCVFTDNSAEYGGALFGFPDSTIMNCIFSGNRADEGGALCTDGWGPNLINCTLADNWAQNSKAIGLHGSGRGANSLVMAITNCILWNGFDEIRLNGDQLLHVTITHTNIQGGWPSWPWQGIIYSEPCFVKHGYWIHANNPDIIVEPDDPNAVWTDGDYHLKSQAGRWNPVSRSWIIDDITSPCIDAGDPNSPVAFEPFPNGGRINMGAYGGTAEAGMSTSGLHAKYGGGMGEPNDPYLIYTAEHMNTIGTDCNDWDKHFKLMANIDLNDFGDSSFNLIGSPLHPFNGVFDGNGHSISNLTYAVTGNEGLTEDTIIASFGLFRSINDPNAMIRDLRLVNPDVRPATTCVMRLWQAGALVGAIGSGSVINCQVEGGQVHGESRIGGLAGLSGGTISDCNTTCRVQQAGQRSLASDSESHDRREFFGGLVGINLGQISNCHTTGEISGERKIGGLVGEDHGIISNSWSGSDVSGDLDIGGLVGKNNYTSEFSNCYATGYVSGSKSVGGLIGYCKGSIIDCYTTGSVTAEQWGGGLAGFNEGTVTACYSNAPVTVDFETAGGLVGLNGGTVLTSLARGDVTGEESIGGLVGENRKWYQIVAGIPIEYDGVVLDSYAKGNVHGKYGVGGLVGTNTGTVLKCYSTGRVTGEGNFGGLVGVNGEIPVLGSFWDTETSGLDISSGGTGKTSTEMQIPSTFLEAGWDFADETANGTEDIWWILEGQDYPRLWWELTENILIDSKDIL